jgi:predicted Zn finger-like uncharacterized protein
MIAACPKCAARYRIERDRLEAGGGVRLRCSRCEAVFRVRPPPAEEAPAAQPAPAMAAPAVQKPPAAARPAPVAPRPAAAPASGECVLVAMRESDLAKRTADLLETRGYAVLRAPDGVEAMLEIQRRLPRAVVLSADLPKMFGFQICEILKRNPSLERTWVVLVGAIHHPDRYRRDADELYGADAYLESPDLPDGILPLLERGGVMPGAAKPAAAPAPKPAAAPAAAPKPSARPAPALPRAAPPPAPPRPAPAPQRPRAAEPPAAAARPRRNDGLEDERAKAERLARIVVSDIVLYNEERFVAAARAGNVLEAMAGDLAEGRALFEERVDPRVRAERDYLTEELIRNAKLRGMR